MEQNTIPLPEIGELVVGTILRIAPYGAYVTLDEYGNIEGLMHISEIASSWIKNIRDHVREGQKTVLKVLRVDPIKIHVDVSLRRVNEKERKEKLLQWKREIRGRNLLEIAAEKMNASPEEAYEKIGVVIEDHFGSIYSGLEIAAEQGISPLIDVKITEDWATVLVEIAKEKVRVPKSKSVGTLELSCFKPNGVNILKKAFKKGLKIKKPNNADIKIYSIGAPNYRIEVIGRNYKESEKLLENIVRTILKTVESSGGEGRIKS